MGGIDLLFSAPLKCWECLQVVAGAGWIDKGVGLGYSGY